MKTKLLLLFVALLCAAFAFDPAVNVQFSKIINYSCTFAYNGRGWLCVTGDRSENSPSQVYRPNDTRIVSRGALPVVRKLENNEWQITFVDQQP